MGIDRKRVEDLKGRTDPIAMVVKDTAGLVRAFRACRTAGELVDMDRKYCRHCKVLGLKVDARNRNRKFRHKEALIWFEPAGREMPEWEVLEVLARGLANARMMPEHAPLPEDFWVRMLREFEIY